MGLVQSLLAHYALSQRCPQELGTESCRHRFAEAYNIERDNETVGTGRCSIVVDTRIDEL